MTLEWLQGQMRRLRGAWEAGRFPHAVLIHEAPGAGGEWLALWAAQLVLCTQPTQAPCGQCPACRHVARRQHPDLALLGPLEEATQIRIEQVRELSADLALTAHQGGYKVGILSPADSLNRFAANALLKTLEEPPPRTLLVLVATQPSRLPATLLSRCQRVRVQAPTREQALEWLRASRGEADWEAVLAVLGEAPVLAAQADPAVLVETAIETRRDLAQAGAGEGDPVAVAERWVRSEPKLRLACFENWLTERIRERLIPRAAVPEVRSATHSGGSDRLNIRDWFELLDAVRELRSSFDVPINRGVALEALLRRLASGGAA